MTDEQKLKISSTKIGKPWSELRREVGYAKDAELARLRNPMKDPAKIEKMLNTRKRNKELRMVVN